MVPVLGLLLSAGRGWARAGAGAPGRGPRIRQLGVCGNGGDCGLTQPDCDETVCDDGSQCTIQHGDAAFAAQIVVRLEANQGCTRITLSLTGKTVDGRQFALSDQIADFAPSCGDGSIAQCTGECGPEAQCSSTPGVCFLCNHDGNTSVGRIDPADFFGWLPLQILPDAMVDELKAIFSNATGTP